MVKQHRHRAVPSLLAAVCLLATTTAARALELHSSAFVNNGDLPARLTCTDAGHSPPLEWSGAPAGTKSFVLIVVDPDAPDPKAPTRTVIHWILYNLPANERSLPEGMDGAPQGGLDGMNDMLKTGYSPPCPPIGRHRYIHTLYAMDENLPSLGAATRESLADAMKGHVLATAELIGTYEKRRKSAD
jgi:Raf kinase inhibitor-like YbhB/YbcL family protein